MQVSAARLPFYAAGLAVIVAAAVTGCASSSSTAQAPVSPLEAVKLAANISNTANSFTGTLTLKATTKPGAASTGNISLSGAFAEQLHPSRLVSADFSTFSIQGTSLSGGFGEIATPKALYLRWSEFTTLLHTTKPWVEIPLSILSSSSGVNFTQLFSQASSDSPLTQSQILAGATNVRKAGTGTIGGVPVTEYTGTVPLDKGLGFLSGSAKTQLQQQIAAAGITTGQFTVWIDGQNITRKAVITEDGKSIDETITTTITSINQPVNIAIPAASQTYSLTAADLSNAG